MPSPKIVVSKNGEAHGWGSDPWKWVSFLSLEERQKVFEPNTLVVVTRGVPEVPGLPRFRVVVAYGRQLFHRVPDSSLWPVIKAAISGGKGE